MLLGPRESPAAPVSTFEEWRQQLSSALASPGLARFYTFEDLSPEGPAVPNLAGDTSAALSFRVSPVKGAPPETLRLVPGRWPQKKAVRLDQGFLAADPFPVPDRAFSASAWMRFSGPGTHRGNNESTNGVLLSAGTGYWDGWRLTLNYPSRQLGFELGRPKPAHATGIRSEASVSDGDWHHLAVTWDGSEMRLYLDGLRTAQGNFQEAYAPPPPGAAFRIGYANAGMGSVVLDVDEVAIYQRALTSEEVLRGAALGGPGATGALRNRARVSRDRNDLASARSLYREWLAIPGLDSPSRLETLFEFARLCESPEDFATLRSGCAAMADAPGLTASQRSLARLALARSLALEKNYPAARASYGKLSALPDAPPHLQQEAATCIRELDRLEKGLPARDPLATRTPPPLLPEPGLTLFVAPGGSDSHPGSAAQPFATLERARDEVRALRQKATLPPGGVQILVRGGDYRVAQTFQLTAADSGTPGAPVVYTAPEGETPHFSGGVRVTEFKPVTESALLSRLPEEARNQVMQCDLRSLGIQDYGTFTPGGYGSGRGSHTHPALEVFWNGEPLTLARWPNDSFVETGETVGEHKVDGRGRTYNASGQFTYQEDRPARWTTEPDPWLYGYWFHDWSDSYEKVASIDTAKRLITLAPPLHRSGFVKSRRFYALNLFSEIDQPGEWYLDRGRGLLYLWPPSDPAQAVVELSMLGSPQVELKGASHVVFRRFDWDLGRGDALRLEGGEHCLLQDCTVRRFAGDGVVVNGGQSHRLLGCHIHTLGRGGVRLKGGDRITLTPGGHLVENCHLHHLSRIDHTYTPAVHADGAGIRIAHNLMHHTGSSAMRIEGNDHLVELNEVHHVVWESDDQGGVDMFGNPTYRGNVFRHNFFHHIGSGRSCGQAGIRLDDAISGTLLYGNIFWLSASGHFGGVQIHGGKDNWVDNNLFLDCEQAISFSPWGPQRWEEFLSRPDVAAKIAQVNPGQPPYSTRYPALAALRENPDANFIWRNVAVRCGLLLRQDRGIHELVANTSIGAEAPPSAPGSQPQSLREVAAWAARANLLPFRPIPFEEIGLYGKTAPGR